MEDVPTPISGAIVRLLKVGATANVSIAGVEKPVEGKVTLVSPALDPGSTTVEVWVKIDNKQGELKPGTAARIAIAAESVKDTVVIPTSAILKDEAGQTMVMVVENSAAKKREVSTGIKDGDDIQVISGLKGGEQVITTGGYGLDDGTKVKVAPAEDKKMAAAAISSAEPYRPIGTLPST